MKVSYDEGLASHVDPESCGAAGNGVAEALTGERAGWVLSSEILTVRDADALMSCGRLNRPARQREGRSGPAESKTPGTHRSISQGRTTLPFGSREIPDSTWAVAQVRAVNSKEERRQ